jgi:hypothetical protein
MGDSSRCFVPIDSDQSSVSHANSSCESPAGKKPPIVGRTELAILISHHAL